MEALRTARLWKGSPVSLVLMARLAEPEPRNLHVNIRPEAA
jgi:hypothetical protein